MIGAPRLMALVLLGGVFVMEGYDINAMALAVPRLEGALGLVAVQFRAGVHRTAGGHRHRRRGAGPLR